MAFDVGAYEFIDVDVFCTASSRTTSIVRLNGLTVTVFRTASSRTVSESHVSVDVVIVSRTASSLVTSEAHVNVNGITVFRTANSRIVSFAGAIPQLGNFTIATSLTISQAYVTAELENIDAGISVNLMSFPEGSVENVVRSLYSYIFRNYTETAIYILGQHAFDTTQLSEWVEFELGTAARRFMRHVDGNRPTAVGNIVSYYMDAVIYVRPTDNITRIVHIRDILSNLFQRSSVPVYDYANSHPENLIGQLISNGLIVDVPLGFKDDLNRWTLSFDMKWIEVLSG